ncbi:MAG: hypothetical protein ACTSRK_03865 [Promethearchaeota archaeon]
MKSKVTYSNLIIKNFRFKYLNFSFLLLYGWIILIFLDYNYLIEKINSLDLTEFGGISTAIPQEFIMQIVFTSIFKLIISIFVYFFVVNQSISFNLSLNASNLNKISTLGDSFHGYRFDNIYGFFIIVRHFLLACFLHMCLLVTGFIFDDFFPQVHVLLTITYQSAPLILVILVSEWVVYRIGIRFKRRQQILQQILNQSITKSGKKKNTLLPLILFIIIILKFLLNIYHYSFYNRTEAMIPSFFIISRLFNNQIILLLIIFTISAYFTNILAFIFSKWNKLNILNWQNNTRKSPNETLSFSQIIYPIIPIQSFRLLIIAIIYGVTNVVYSILLDNSYSSEFLSLFQNTNYFYSPYSYLLGGYLFIFSLYYLTFPVFEIFTRKSETFIGKLSTFGMQRIEIKKKIAKQYTIYIGLFLGCGFIISVLLAFFLKIGFVFEFWI